MFLLRPLLILLVLALSPAHAALLHPAVQTVAAHQAMAGNGTHEATPKCCPAGSHAGTSCQLHSPLPENLLPAPVVAFGRDLAVLSADRHPPGHEPGVLIRPPDQV